MAQGGSRYWLLLLLCSLVLAVACLASGAAAAPVPPPAAGPAAEPAAMVAPDMPTGVQASDGTYDTHIRVTWNTVSGTTHYYVHRRLDSTPNFDSGVVWAVPSPPFDNRYDKAMPPTPYVTYYYWVRSCNGQDCSAWTGPDSGWRPDLATATPTATRAATPTRTRTRTPTGLTPRKVLLPLIRK